MKNARLARSANKKKSPKASKKPVKKVSSKPPKVKKLKAKVGKNIVEFPAKLAASVKKLLSPAKVSSKTPKQEERKKKVLTNPIESFFGLWKPKVETFEVGFQKLLAEYSAEKDDPAGQSALSEKILAHLRKEPLPHPIEEQLLERFHRERIHKMASIWGMKPRSTLRLNILKADIQGFAASMAAKELKVKPSTLSPWAFEVGKPEEAHLHPTYERGLYEFQDEASQLISLLINARPGQRILDLSAGEGENALALSAMMRNKGSLFVYDSDPKKLKAYRERAERAGIDNFRILSDTQISEVKSLDSVLIQAPNSGLGLLGSHPDLKWRFQKEDLPRIQKLQAALLREGARKLKLGGYMIYATYTLNKSENEQQIEHFLRSTHNSYRLVTAASYMKDFIVPYVQNFFNFTWDEKTLASFSEFDPYFVMSPDVHSSPGCFAAIIQRIRIST